MPRASFRDLFTHFEAVLLRQRKVLDLVYLRRWAGETAKHTLKFEVPQKLEELLDRAAHP